MKYRPEFPRKPFESLEHARKWVARFVAWYNGEHLHSGIGFVAPEQRHQGRDLSILKLRRAVYERAKARHPQRWSSTTRAWTNDAEVVLNPTKETKLSQLTTAHAA